MHRKEIVQDINEEINKVTLFHFILFQFDKYDLICPFIEYINNVII